MHRKKMKKSRYLFCSIVFLFVVGFVFLGIYFYPVYKGAKVIQANKDLTPLSYEMKVVLKEENFTQEQQKWIQVLSKITGREMEDFLHLTICGEAQNDVLSVKIIPNGMETPLTEFYLSKEQDVMNVQRLYDSIRDYFIEQSALLKLIFPSWSGKEYISLEQMEQLFSVDLTTLKEFELSPFTDLSFAESFGLLAVMEREQEQKFSFEEENIMVLLSFLEQAERPILYVSCQISNIQEVLKEYDKFLQKIEGLQIESLQNLESFSMQLTLGEAENLIMPESVVEQETIDRIVVIRDMLGELIENFQ